LSLFPLRLVLVTIPGYALAGNPSLQRRIVESAFAQLPVIGTDVQQHALTGSRVALAFGIVGALWTEIGVFLAAEHALSRI
jgi:membrane protein